MIIKEVIIINILHPDDGGGDDVLLFLLGKRQDSGGWSWKRSLLGLLLHFLRREEGEEDCLLPISE